VALVDALRRSKGEKPLPIAEIGDLWKDRRPEVKGW
jgi:hypothetical protein